MLRRLLPVVALPVVVFPILTSRVSAQSQDTARVSPVVVTATRTPLTQGSLPVAVTVITAEELKLRGVQTVADALRDVTSAYVAQSGSQGAQTSLFLRGGESKYVKVLVDGVPANDPGGFYDFSSLTADNVERIEVVRGPASVVHGADAVTGVVHVITKRGSGPPATAVEARLGTAPRTSLAGGSEPDGVQAYDLNAEVSGAREAVSYSIGIARHETTGLYELNNRHYNNVLSGRIDLQPVAGTTVRVSLRYNDFRFNYPTNGGGVVGDVNSNRVEDRTIIGVALDRAITDKLAATLTLNSALNDGDSDDAADSATDASSLIQDKMRRRGADLQLRWLAAAKASVTAGVTLERQDYHQTTQSQSSFGPFMSSFRADRSNKGAYGEVVLMPAAALTATLGARLDDNEAFGTFLTHRAGLSYRPLAATRIRGTFGNAFREPTFTENFASGFATGNPDLETERSTSWDAGIDQDLLGGRASASLTYFAQRFSNIIDYDPSDSCGFSYCNIAEATANGAEVELRGRLPAGLWASAGATFLETEVVEPGFDQTSGGLYKAGESLIRRPEEKITGEVGYRRDKLPTLSLRVQRVGERTDRDFRDFPSTPVTLPSYTRFDLGAEYALPVVGGAHNTVTLRVENLTDEEYQNVFNFLAPRRTVVLGIRARF
jgi:vitamin B12 transporter